MIGGSSMQEGSAVSYRVFVRDWWRAPMQGEPGYTSVLHNPRVVRVFRVPYPGAPKRTLARRCTEEEARAMCEEYARTHKPGWRSRKAEYERE